MSQPPRWVRLAAYIALLALTTVIGLYVVVQSTVAIAVLNQHRVGVSQYAASISQLIPQAPARVGFPQGALPSMRLLHEQMIHRHYNGWALVAAQYKVTPPATSFSSFDAALEAIVHPTGLKSRGVTTDLVPALDGLSVVPRTTPYIRPRQLHSLVSGRFLDSKTEDVFESSFMTAAAVAMLSGVLLLMPLAFVLLPVSRRKAKVRWRHIARVTAYSVIIPVSLYWILAAMMVGSLAKLSIGWMELRMFLFPYPALMVLIFAFFWWWAAIKHHLRIPHAMATALLMEIMCMLGVLAIAYYTFIA